MVFKDNERYLVPYSSFRMGADHWLQFQNDLKIVRTLNAIVQSVKLVVSAVGRSVATLVEYLTIMRRSHSSLRERRNIQAQVLILNPAGTHPLSGWLAQDS